MFRVKIPGMFALCSSDIHNSIHQAYPPDFSTTNSQVFCACWMFIQFSLADTDSLTSSRIASDSYPE